MKIFQVGPSRTYPTINAALQYGVDGMAIEVDRGLKYTDEVHLIKNNQVSIFGDWSDWNNLTSFCVKLHPILTKVTKTSLLSLGVTQTQIDTVLSGLAYKQPTATFTLPDSSLHTVSVGWDSTLLTKGIFTTKEGTSDFHIEGFEIFDARLSDYSGSGVRTQGFNNSVTHCKIHDCQAGILCNHQMVQDVNGLWKIVDGNPVSVNMVGYNLTADNWMWNNGCLESGGLDHDTYAPDCAVSVHARNKEWDCLGGHHEKVHGAVFQISLGQNAIDTDTGLTSQTLDGDSGLIYYINGNVRKVDPVNSISNTGEIVFARNNRDNSPFGNFFMMRGSRLDSTVHKPGSFAKVLNSPAYKDDLTGALGIPSPFTFDIQWNVCTSIDYTKINAKGQIVDDTTDYLTKPFNVPIVGGVVANNYVGKTDDPTPNVSLVNFNKELFEDPANILTDLKIFLDTLGQTDKASALAYCQQHITLPLEDPVMIAEQQTLINTLKTTADQLATALQADDDQITQLTSTVTQLNTTVTAQVSQLALKDGVISSLKDEIAKAKADLSVV